MTYEVITLDKKKKERVVWGTIYYPMDEKNSARAVSFLEYLKSSVTPKFFDDFMVYEVETDKAFQLSRVYDHMIKKLSA